MIQTVEKRVNTNASSSTNTKLVPPPPSEYGLGGKGYPLSASSIPQGARLFTWEEVARHNTRESAWVYAHNKVYDITQWFDKHPGGNDALLLAAGRDVTDLIQTYHPFSGDKPMDVLAKFEIGYINSIEFPQYRPDSGFYRELRERVGDYFKKTNQNPKNPIPGSIRLFFMLLTAFISHYIIISDYSLTIKIIASILFGICQALPLLHTMHDCSHLAYSNISSMWIIMGRFTMDYFAGASLVSWHHQHVVGHHVYTNVLGADPDLPMKRDGDPRRIVSEQSYFSIYRYQHIYLLILYGVLAIKFRIQDITDTLISHTNAAIRVNGGSNEIKHQIVSKSFWFTWRILCPIIFFNVDLSQFFSLFLISEFVTGYYLTFNFQVSHVSPSAAFPTLTDIVSFDDEWAPAQLKTTVEYAHSDFIATFLCGALNYQGVHHLFPSVSQYYYPQIASIVAQVAKKYNVPYYVVPTFWEAFKLHVQHLKNMGFEHVHMH